MNVYLVWGLAGALGLVFTHAFLFYLGFSYAMDVIESEAN